jgi:hypothetical protein
MNMSDFFDVTLGLKQGEPLSPLLFILFLNDIEKCIDLNKMSNSDLELLSKYLLLFADDIVLFTTSPESLQAQVDNVYSYSSKWGLKINVNKTKVCVFERRKSVHNFSINIDGQFVDIVDNFSYLGVKFSYTGSFSEATKTLAEQGLRAYNSLLGIFDRIKLDVKTKLHLFDSLITPILLYGSDVWGIYKYKDIDKLQIKFYKYVLGVKKQTPNCAVYGELGKFPLSILCKERSLKFWNKIVNNQHSPIYSMYLDQCVNGNNKCWARQAHTIINELGFSYLLDNYNVISDFSLIFKQRLRDQFIQNWHEQINNMPKLFYFRNFKSNFCFEEYLNVIQNDKLRKRLTCFRLGSHSLEIETGRYIGLNRSERICKLCTQNMIESEYHFLLCCPFYSELRKLFIRNASFPTLNKFYYIMSSNNKHRLLLISKYLDKAFDLRSNTMEQMINRRN